MIQPQGYETNQNEGVDACATTILVISYLMIAITLPCSLFFCFKKVEEYEQAVVFRMGSVYGLRGPGIHFYLPCTDNFLKVDLRSVSFHLPTQEMLTKDGAAVTVETEIRYRITPEGVTLSVTNVENAQESTQLLAQQKLSQLIMEEETMRWGVKIEEVKIKVIRSNSLPPPAQANEEKKPEEELLQLHRRRKSEPNRMDHQTKKTYFTRNSI